MISTTPSTAEVDATMNLLSVLELAKDATALKKAISQIKDAQDKAAAERKAADEAIAKANAEAKALSVQQGLLEHEAARIKAEDARSMQTARDAAAEREAIREERSRFDAWMASEREAIANLRASVDAGADQNERRAAALAKSEEDVAKRAKDVEQALAAAEAKRAEYEAKMANLKAMVS